MSFLYWNILYVGLFKPGNGSLCTLIYVIFYVVVVTLFAQSFPYNMTGKHVGSRLVSYVNF